MKKGTKVWLDFAHRDLEAARLLVDSEYVSNVVLFHAHSIGRASHLSKFKPFLQLVTKIVEVKT